MDLAIQVVNEQLSHQSDLLIIIQGDNSAVVLAMAQKQRFKAAHIHLILEAAISDLAKQTFTITWEYIPRELNKVADALAGIASRVVKDARQDEGTLINLRPIKNPPRDELMKDKPSTIETAFSLVQELSLAKKTGTMILPLQCTTALSARILAQLQRRNESWCALLSNEEYEKAVLAFRRCLASAQLTSKYRDTGTLDITYMLSRWYLKGTCQEHPCELPYLMRKNLMGDHTICETLSTWTEFCQIAKARERELPAATAT